LPDVAFASVAWQLCMQAKSGVQRERIWRIQKEQDGFLFGEIKPQGSHHCLPALFSDTCLLFLESDRSSALRLSLVDCAVDRQVEPLHW
jgi:hypothetical protein